MFFRAQRVSRGARAFDVIDPDWYHKIDEEELDIEFSTTCIVGQLYGSWHSENLPSAVERLQGRWLRYGLMGGDKITKLWAQEIKARRDAQLSELSVAIEKFAPPARQEALT